MWGKKAQTNTKLLFNSLPTQTPSLCVSHKHTQFPWALSHFHGCMCLQFSLLSKKGLRYLLYPFISLWMVGGRISPSFTSALSSVLSKNLGRRKMEKKNKREMGEWNYSLFLCPWCIYWLETSLLAPFNSVQLRSVDWDQQCPKNLISQADWKKRHEIEMAKKQLGTEKNGGEERQGENKNAFLNNWITLIQQGSEFLKRPISPFLH